MELVDECNESQSSISKVYFTRYLCSKVVGIVLKIKSNTLKMPGLNTFYLAYPLVAFVRVLENVKLLKSIIIAIHIVYI